MSLQQILMATGGGVASSPADIAGLIMWNRHSVGQFQDAAMTTPATGTDPVGAWADQSGVGNNLTQPVSGNRPILSSGSVVFNGSNTVLTADSTLLLKPASFFVIIVTLGSVAGNHQILGASSSQGLAVDANGTSLRVISNGIAAIGTATTTLVTSTAYRIIVTYGATGDYAFYVDGVAAGSGTNDLGIISAIPSMGGPDTFLNGTIKEWGLYDNAISAPDAVLLDGYLATV